MPQSLQCFCVWLLSGDQLLLWAFDPGASSASSAVLCKSYCKLIYIVEASGSQIHLVKTFRIVIYVGKRLHESENV